MNKTLEALNEQYKRLSAALVRTTRPPDVEELKSQLDSLAKRIEIEVNKTHG